MRRDFKVWAGRQGRRESVLPTTPSLPTPTAEDQTREGLKNKQVLIPLTRLYDIKKKIGRLKEEEEERERFTHMLPLLCCCHFLKKGGFSLFKDSSIIKPVTPVNCISQHISRKRRTDFIKDHLKGFFFYLSSSSFLHVILSTQNIHISRMPKNLFILMSIFEPLKRFEAF